MIRFKTTADVPENRQVVVTLPSDVSPGPVELVVEVRTEPEQVFEVKLDPDYLRQFRPDRPSDPKLAREFDAFQQMLPELLSTSTQRGAYVAIHDGQVVAEGTDKLTVIQKAYRQFGHQPILVQLVAEEQPVVRIPSVFHPRSGPRS